MPLDNKLQRKRLASDTYKDDMSADKTESPLNILVPVLAASAGLYAMYKKGMLQPLVKSGMEVFESVAKNSTDKAYMNLKGIKEWTKFENLSPDKLKEMGYRVPKDSIFRGKGINKLKSLGLDTISEIEKGDIRLGYARKVINDTVEDVNQLKRLIEENTKRVDSYRQKYYDSDLITGMKELRKFSREVNANNPNARLFVNEKATQEFINMHTLSQEEERRLLKINGYRPVMLQDIMEAPEKVQLDEGSKYIYKVKEGAKINLKDNTGTQVYNSADELLGVMGSSDFRYMNKSGKTTNMIGDWENTKRLILDKNILIDESGNLIDLRMSDEMLKGIKESITKDFQIPGLGFNPLTSLFPSWTNARIRKPSFGMLSKNSIQPFITGEAGQKFLGEDLFVINGKAFKMAENGLEQVADNIVLNDISRAGQYGFNKKVETARKMANLNYYNFKLKDNIKQEIDSGSLKGKLYNYLDKINKWLDSGKPDNYVHKTRFNPDGERIDIDNEWAFNPDIDSFLTNKIHKLTSKFNMYEAIDIKTPEDIFGDGPKDIINEITNSTEQSRKFIATRKGMSINDLKEQEGIENKISFTKDYLGQFFAGRNKDNTISNLTTETSLRAYGLFDNVFGRLNAIAPQLGFGTESKGSLPEYIKNIALKRVLPIYAITQAPEMLNALSEPIFNLFNNNEDGTDNKNNITKFITSNIVKPLDLGMHKVKDILGITKLNKKIEEFTPGFDQINELPGIYHLGLTQTYEEREDYIENGYDPIRKARYWGMGNTPFTGGKIMYWRPNLYRRIEADVDFSDSKWGSRQEYYSNTWYPNPVNPLAPINHFILDRNHYDKKHYYDRPYLLTSKEGNNIPIIGPLYSATVGNVINSQKRMHEEYWENNKPVEKNDENVAIVDYVNQATLYQRQSAYNNAFINSNIITSVNNTYKESQTKDGYARTVSTKQAQEVVQYNSSPQNIISGNILPTQTDNTFSSFMGNLSNLEIYTTPSGSTSLVDIPDTLTTWEANQRLKEYSIKRFPEADSRVELKDENKFNPQLADYTNEKINNSFIYNTGEEFNTLADFFGMKGFETQAFITGEANVGAKTIEDSNYAYSFNKSFWDENLGGFGGDASEIFRRFVQKRNTDTEYINPIRNTMPSWMPGRNYFTDFKHGDPYSKIDNGEERLPGEGYERLAGINTKKLFELGIGSSYIGKSKEDIQKHLLNQDTMDSFGIEVTESGTKTHEQIEKAWLESGLAINTEGKIEDKQNNILGYYDALVHDPTSKTGKAIVDIKTVGDKKFNKILQQGHPEFEHQSQTNYYLWATGNKKSNGYIYYVNRDNPEQTFTMGFQFDENLLQQNLNTLNQARNEIYTGLENGTIGRGELYSNLDRYRILADVAPYSDEFQSIKARLANDPNLTKEEQEEISQINERVKQQKEPLRVYPYKFKTSNLETERVTVKKVLDNNTLLVDRYGVEHAIKFAGVHINESNTDKYDKNTTMNEAAAKELKKYIKRGKTITIGYDYDEANKFKKDSTESIRAVVYSNGRNINKLMLNKGLATEKDDDSPAAIHARYTKNEIAFGSAMERITHKIGSLPFIGNKFFQVKSPYEQYRDREVYGKDFQSWNNPIRDYLGPEMIDKVISHGNNGPGGIVTATVLGTFLGSLFGGSKFGKMIGGVAGGTIGLIGGTYANTQKTKDKDWIPKRRKKQAELNEYFDTLKYVKNMSLYEKYKEKALKEDHVDVTKLEGSKELQGIYNKNKTNELKDFKKVVKLDYKHRKQFDFKYGAPENLDMDADAKSIIKSINQELTKIQSDRSVERIPENVVKAVSYKQQADQTMYGYETGDPLNNLMKALPKKERQYFKYFMKAPEEEKDKILRIAPDYLKRGLQQAWGMEVDKKPSLQEYFQTHGLPDASWIGWDENTNIEDVKVKLVHNNKLDMGEFDLWNDQISQANQTNIPVPKIRSQNSNRMVQLRLQSILGKAGYEDAVVTPYFNAKGNKNTLNVYQDSRDDISDAIYNMNI